VEISAVAPVSLYQFIFAETAMFESPLVPVVR
jgi:hypothetical protein